MEIRRIDGDIGVHFSKKGIIEFIEAQFAKADTDESWTEEITKPEFKVYKHKQGSHVTDKHLFMKSEGSFNSKFKMSRILKALFDPRHRAIWEKKNLEVY